MSVTNREAEQWNRVAQAAADRSLKRARESAIAEILARPPVPVAVVHKRRVYGQMALSLHGVAGFVK